MRSRSIMALAAGATVAVLGLSAAPGSAAPAGRTVLVSLATDGTLADSVSFWPSLSGDGRFVAFTSMAENLVPGDRNGAFDVFLRDQRTGTTERISVGDDGTELPDGAWQSAISRDGRYVAFTAWPSHDPAVESHGWYVCVRDRWLGTTTPVSVTSTGEPADNASEAPAISADGRHVGFDSYASDLVPNDSNGNPDTFVRKGR